MRYQRLVPVLLAVASACNVFEPEVHTELGTVFFFDNPAMVSVPAEVNAGQRFTVEIVTYGNGCVSFGRTEIETDLDGGVVEIRPYDRVETEGPCADILRTIPHRATLQFDTPGTVEIRVIGQRFPGEFEERITRTVTVR